MIKNRLHFQWDRWKGESISGIWQWYGEDYKEEINKVNNTGSLIGVSEMSIIDWLEWSTLR